jgi:hypothetical protein
MEAVKKRPSAAGKLLLMFHAETARLTLSRRKSMSANDLQDFLG